MILLANWMEVDGGKKQWYDTFGMLFADEDFRVLFPRDGPPALSPVRLSQVLWGYITDPPVIAPVRDSTYDA